MKFPVLVGETGSAYTERDDKTWLRDFADFANAEVSVTDNGTMRPVCLTAAGCSSARVYGTHMGVRYG
jgi:hypothetical protein